VEVARSFTDYEVTIDDNPFKDHVEIKELL